MRAVRLGQIGVPLENAEIEVPEIGLSEVLIRVGATGICHSDAHYRAGISKIDNLPVTLGHEVAGTVEKIGTEVTSVAAGVPPRPTTGSGSWLPAIQNQSRPC